MEELIYHYKAFISHTECDSDWAKKLHNKLNHYSIPTKLKKTHPDLPKNLRPVFWYKRDISELHLKKVIRKELYNSEYLIVICSPESAQSEWVNEEVRIFKEDFGRGDRIIPFIVDGTANSNNHNDECFPKLLRNLPIDDQIRGIDVRGEDGAEGAYINVIATMLRIRYDELYQRHLREKMKKIYSWIAIFILASIMAFFTYDYNFNTKYEYYLDYADCYGKPVGIMPIDKSQAKNEYRTYRFEYLRNILRRVVYVDCKGNIQPINNTEYIDRFPIQELLYENGEYVGLECKSYLGDIICKYNYSKSFNSVNISDNDDDLATSIIRSASSITDNEEQKAKSHFIDNILLLPSKIGRYEYDRDSLGYITTIYYCKEPYKSQRTTDVNGIAGIKYLRDSLHRVISLQYIDLQGNPKANDYGVVCKKYTYDTNGHLSISEYHNNDGELQYNELGWAKAIVEHDINGYPIKQSLYGNDGKHCNSIIGESITKYEWDKDSLRVSFYDDKENPILVFGSASIPGGFHSYIQEFDSNGDIIQIAYYDKDDNLCYNSFHWAISKQVFYNRRPVEQSYWSPEKEPCYNYIYVHRIKKQYQDELIISESYWGPDNAKILGPAGFHSIYLEYKHKKISKIRTYNIMDMLSPSQILSNAAQVEIEYQDDYPSAVLFKDINGNLCIDPLRDKNNPMLPYRDWAICRIKNENGMNTEFSYYDQNDQKMLCFDAYFRKRIEYNETGQNIKTSFYDTKDNLTPNEMGVCIVETQYDTQNPYLPSCFIFKKNNDELCNNNLGVAKIYKTYYPNGKIKSDSYFNEENKPASPQGVHLLNYEYDNKNRLSSVVAMNDKGLPTIHTQNNCHKIEYVYDNINRIIETRRYDTSNKLINRPHPAVIRMTYGSDHQIIRNEYLDNNYNLCNNPEAGDFAICTMEYDQLGRRIHEKYFDENNQVVVNNNMGYAEYSIKFNNNSKLVLFKNECGELTNVQDFCRLIEIYSETSLPLFGRTDRINYEDELELIQRCMWEYDEYGNPISNYVQDNWGRIVIYTPDNSQTIYDFEDEYDDISNKIDSVQNNLVGKYFDDVDL